jgi:hypothetical protein
MLFNSNEFPPGFLPITLVVFYLLGHYLPPGGDLLAYFRFAGVLRLVAADFDFSGYSDMALGLARFFGIRLPQNFDSPLRASSYGGHLLPVECE